MIAESRLRVEGASVSFGPTAALDDVDLAVAPGEVVAIVGPSGSGKTTLLRAVVGLQRLDRGRILLDDADQSRVPTHRRGIGLMFQDHALFPHRDVAGNVGFGLRMRGDRPPAVAARVAELLDVVGLAGFEQRPVASLSGGEQQRVALARALAPSPRLLLLDEPFGALDRTLRERLVEEVGAVVRRLGQTVVAVTHDQGEAFSLGDRVVVMDRGRVLQQGAPAELWARPASEVVARFLGFANVTTAVVEGGVASTPWGPVDTDLPAGRHRILVRPSGVRLAADGDGVRAEVSAATFRGDRVQLRLAVPGAPPLEATVPAEAAPVAGATVTVTLVGAEVVSLDAG